MSDELGAALGLFSVVIVLAGILLAILWIILPFAVFSMNGKLGDIKFTLGEIKDLLHQRSVMTEMRFKTDPAAQHEIRYLEELMKANPERSDQIDWSGVNFNLLTRAEVASWAAKLRELPKDD